MKFIKYAVLFAFLFSPYLSLASGEADPSGVLSGPEVNGVFTVNSILADGHNVLRYFTVNETIHTCTKQTNQFWFDGSYVSKEGLKGIMSVLLLAKSTGRPVTVYFTTADGYCRATLVGIN